MSACAVTWALNQNIKDPYAKLVLVSLASCANYKNGACFPSIALLAEQGSCSERTVQSKIGWLIRRGLLRRIARHGSDGRQLTNAYEFVQGDGEAALHPLPACKPHPDDEGCCTPIMKEKDEREKRRLESKLAAINRGKTQDPLDATIEKQNAWAEAYQQLAEPNVEIIPPEPTRPSDQGPAKHKSSARPRWSAVPEDLALTSARLAVATGQGWDLPRAEAEFAHFLASSRGSGKRSPDWDSAWEEWVLRQVKYDAGRNRLPVQKNGRRNGYVDHATRRMDMLNKTLIQLKQQEACR
jgi:hypothetical protein